jgi:CelD/BcsL family acetyltransferase involved in cellulose biosynthesis
MTRAPGPSTQPPSGSGRAELLDEAGSLAQIEPEWRALAEASGNAFVTPDWFHAWLAHYGEEAEPAVAAVRDGAGALTGVLPLVRLTAGRPRSLRFGGWNLGDHFHPVAAAGQEAAVAGAAASVLPLGSGESSALVLDNVDSESGWWQALEDGGPRNLSTYRVKDAVLPYAELPEGGWDAFLASKSRNFRRDLKRKLSRLEDAHELGFRRTETPAELAADLETLFKLHDLRWADSGGSTAAGDRTRAVLSDFAAAALERGWLRLWTLSLDGQPAAAAMLWRLGDRLAYYYTGFDPVLTREGVGFVVIAHALRAGIEEGASQFDMLLGDEDWKGRFSTGERRVSTVVLVSANSPARFLVSGETHLRRLAGRLPPRLERGVRSAGRAAAGLLPTVRRR